MFENNRYSKALMNTTYINGKPPKLTLAHQQAENHRFKTEFLFKDTEIPKAPYVARLIQHFLIIQAIETQLQGLSIEDKNQLSAFFALTYLEQLWRTSGINKDLKLLGIHSSDIQDSHIAKTTAQYLQQLKTLPPKSLLAHFLLHVAGFMHGGMIIKKKYLEPSNALTLYQIPANQYDFSFYYCSGNCSTEQGSAIALYKDLMTQVDEIALEKCEYAEVVSQCEGIYNTMTQIYDDLSLMHLQQHKPSNPLSSTFYISFMVLAILMSLLSSSLVSVNVCHLS